MKNYTQTLQILNNKTLTAGLLFLTSRQCRIIRGKSFIQRTKYIRAERKQLIEETSFCYGKKTKKQLRTYYSKLLQQAMSPCAVMITVKPFSANRETFSWF